LIFDHTTSPLFASGFAAVALGNASMLLNSTLANAPWLLHLLLAPSFVANLLHLDPLWRLLQ
jgi:hypothetical protein